MTPNVTLLAQAQQTFTKRVPWVLWWMEGEQTKLVRFPMGIKAHAERRRRNDVCHVVYDPQGKVFPI